MLCVTEPARARLNKLLSGSRLETAVRIVSKGGRLRLRRDTPRAGDSSYDSEGRTVLLLDVRMAQALACRTLDICETTDGPRLRLNKLAGVN